MPVLARPFAAVLALLVLGASASPAAVLCVADDGHLALKGAAGNCSHPKSHGRDHGHQGHGPDHGHDHAGEPAHGHDHGHGHGHGTDDGHGCHPCVDVPLLDAPPASSAPALDMPAPPVSVIGHAAGFVLRSASPPPPRRLEGPPPRPPLHLRSLRSVVLTC